MPNPSPAQARRRALRLGLYLLIALLPLLAAPPARAEGDGPIYSVAVEGVISRYTVSYLRRAVGEAEAASATALIIRLGGEGAVLRDVRGLAAELAVAKVPVVVYLEPGTRSGAAGAWLLSAAHIAAMAPGSSFGAAAPLAEPAGNVSEQVRELFVAEVIREVSDWNRGRGRSAAWVERAAREGAVLSNEQAAELIPPAVDLVARDDDDLLTLLEGRAVTLEGGAQRTLHTLGRRAQTLDPSPWERLLLLLADPTLAFLLLVMAGLAIYAEFITPTTGILAGLGAALAVASLAGLLALPVNWLSLAGLLAAFGLVAADLFVPSHGALTVVGILLVILSSLTLFDAAQAPGVAVAFWAIALVSLALAGFAALGIYLVLRTRSRPVTTGQEGMIGRMAEVRQRLAPEGMVFVDGALWRAISEDGDAEPGEYVQVSGVYALRLMVRRSADRPAEGPADPRGSP
jgi:membrane-bound serine protease (ClpP class)